MDREKQQRSLRNEKVKAKRASETEEQRKKRLRIRREKDRARRRTKKLQEEKKRSSETEDHKKQRLATLKTLKRGDENKLERKLRQRRWSLANSLGRNNIPITIHWGENYSYYSNYTHN